MPKILLETVEPQMTSQHGAYALHAVLARLHARMRMHMPTHPGTHTNASTRRPISNTYCFFTATMIGECASVLCHTYIAPLVHSLQAHSARTNKNKMCFSSNTTLFALQYSNLHTNCSFFLCWMQLLCGRLQSPEFLWQGLKWSEEYWVQLLSLTANHYN
jgi:hypothetical protein